MSLAIRAQAEQIADAVIPTAGRPAMVSDPEKVQVFLAALADGNYRETACLVAGIGKATMYATFKRAEQGDPAAMAFQESVEKAEALAEREMVNCVRGAAKKGPQYWAAGATFLERKNPEKWGRRAEGDNGPKVLIQIGLGTTDVAITTVRDPG